MIPQKRYILIRQQVRGTVLWVLQLKPLESLLFRPEQAQTVPAEQAEKYDADVTAVQFHGGSYQLQLNPMDRTGHISAPGGLSVGEKLSLYLPHSAIVAV